MDIPNANEAIEQMWLDQTPSRSMERFKTALEEAIRDKKQKFTFYEDDDDELTDGEKSFIRRKGYELYWDRPCGWYEVYIPNIHKD